MGGASACKEPPRTPLPQAGGEPLPAQGLLLGHTKLSTSTSACVWSHMQLTHPEGLGRAGPHGFEGQIQAAVPTPALREQLSFGAALTLPPGMGGPSGEGDKVG